MKYREPEYGDCPEHGTVIAKWVDYGIGINEAWGVVQNDTQMVAVCPECEEELDNIE